MWSNCWPFAYVHLSCSTIGAYHFPVTCLGVERLGYRPLILIILFYQCVVTTIFSCAPSVKLLLLGEYLADVAFGIFTSSKLEIPALSTSLMYFSRYPLRK